MSETSNSQNGDNNRDQGISQDNNIESKSPDNLSEGQDNEDSDFVVTGDGELDEEDSITPEEDITDGQEVDSLLQESEIPIEQLLARYGMNVNPNIDTADSGNKRTIDNSNADALPNKRKRYPKSDSIKENKNEKNSDNKELEMEELSDDSSSSTAEDDDENEPKTTCKDLINDASGGYNSEDDEDYVPAVEVEKSWKADVRIGTDYQVEVPDFILSEEGILLNREFENKVLNECSLLWDPIHMSESLVIQYERNYAEKIKAPIPNERTIDDEEALFLLTQCNYDTDEALNRLSLGNNARSYHFGNYISTWSEQDCQSFERGFALFNKDFRQIHLVKLKHKSVNEIVLFYYIWKKTARYDEFSKIHRKNKKKPVHPGLTDFMDCLTHEQDMIAESLMNNGSSEKMIKTNFSHKPMASEDSCSLYDDGKSSLNDANITNSVKTSSSNEDDKVEDFFVSIPPSETNNNNNSKSLSPGKIQLKGIIDSGDQSQQPKQHQQQQQHNSAPVLI